MEHATQMRKKVAHVVSLAYVPCCAKTNKELDYTNMSFIHDGLIWQLLKVTLYL